MLGGGDAGFIKEGPTLMRNCHPKKPGTSNPEAPPPTSNLQVETSVP